MGCSVRPHRDGDQRRAKSKKEETCSVETQQAKYIEKTKEQRVEKATQIRQLYKKKKEEKARVSP